MALTFSAGACLFKANDIGAQWVAGAKYERSHYLLAINQYHNAHVLFTADRHEMSTKDIKNETTS